MGFLSYFLIIFVGFFGFRVKWRVKWRVAKRHVGIMVGFVLYAWIRLCFRKLLLLKVASMRTG
jgi:hypothetical protein